MPLLSSAMDTLALAGEGIRHASLSRSKDPFASGSYGESVKVEKTSTELGCCKQASRPKRRLRLSLYKPRVSSSEAVDFGNASFAERKHHCDFDLTAPTRMDSAKLTSVTGIFFCLLVLVHTSSVLLLRVTVVLRRIGNPVSGPVRAYPRRTSVESR